MAHRDQLYSYFVSQKPSFVRLVRTSIVAVVAFINVSGTLSAHAEPLTDTLGQTATTAQNVVTPSRNRQAASTTPVTPTSNPTSPVTDTPVVQTVLDPQTITPTPTAVQSTPTTSLSTSTPASTESTTANTSALPTAATTSRARSITDTSAASAATANAQAMNDLAKVRYNSGQISPAMANVLYKSAAAAALTGFALYALSALNVKCRVISLKECHYVKDDKRSP